jgi:hypothetical protein
MQNGPQKPKKRTKTGLYALKTLVQMRGLQGINRSTLAGRALVRWKDELMAALGGPEQVSPQRAVLIDLVVRTRLYIECVDTYLLKQRSIIDKEKKSVLPVVRERQGLCDSLARLLGQLGLDRIELDGGTLPEAWIEKVKPYDFQPEEQPDPAPAEEEKS